MINQYEVHFQEGFDGDAYEVCVEGKTASSGSLTTRNQIGLAEIARFEATPGKNLTIKLPNSGETIVLKLPKSEKFLRVNKISNRIAVEWAGISPGYV